MAKADYDAGNRRFSDAWAVLDKTDVPHAAPGQQSACWEGALLYLGVFGARAELPALLAFADKDRMLEGETHDINAPDGVTDLGEKRARTHRFVYLALAAQVRRQFVFDGALDSAGQRAAAVLRDCATDHARCLPETPMHVYRQHRHQRHAARGLAICGDAASWAALRALEGQLASHHALLPYAISEGKHMRAEIEQRLSFIAANVPNP